LQVFFFGLLQSDFSGQFSGRHLAFLEHEKQLVLKEKDQAKTEENDRIDITLDTEQVREGSGYCIREKSENTNREPKGSTKGCFLPTRFRFQEPPEQIEDETQ
jgi:hypothetical protein